MDFLKRLEKFSLMTVLSYANESLTQTLVQCPMIRILHQ